MSFQFKQKRPWPQWRFTVAFLLIITLLILLGVWQLQRAEEKRVIESTVKKRLASEPLRVGNTELQLVDNEYHRGIAQGQFDGKHTVFLDNQIHQGQAGYHVLTPLRLAGGENAILVNRGWVPMGVDRQQLPEVETPRLPITVHGILRRPPKAAVFLGDESNRGSVGWPKLVQYVDIEQLQSQLGYSLQPLVLQLAPEEPHGFVRQWPSFPTSVQKHIAYAIQWFAMALVAVVVYVILFRRRLDSNGQRNKD